MDINALRLRSCVECYCRPEDDMGCGGDTAESQCYFHETNHLDFKRYLHSSEIPYFGYV